ncbi:polyprenol monophosphomannose synthase [Stieleria marina]|uniref:Undecaprenyl-phosphate mannosyltransferase n=1 Tax=Stieleria marina TaxID=1930275 RepID=A0A517NW36_9BACT|nr:Undecaprenyl-phosphate mannosyltransferase [Planctomycetes bacterium K23_9]
MNASSRGVSAAEPDTHSRALIGVCTYNEAANIQRMVQRLRSALPTADVLVIDDDSPDGTADLVHEISENDARVNVHVRKNQRGLGGAIVAAAQVAIDSDYDFFINLDGDLSHDPAQLPALLSLAMASPEVDVVVGSRYVAGGEIVGWPFRRRVMSWIVNRFATLFLRLPLRDCSGSMRCYRVSALRALDLSTLRCQGYALLEELLVRLHRSGSQFAEVPITFTERQDGLSKLTLREAVRSMWFMVRLAFASK